MGNLFYEIGFFGPLINLVTTSFFLLNQKTYLLVYLVFFFINTHVNKILKSVFREPRPKNSIFVNEIDNDRGSDKYGMPSGHAQSVFFSLAYLYLVKENPYAILLETFIASLTLYQRWKFNRHTISQLFVGSLFGIFMAFIAHFIVKKYLTTKKYIGNI